MTWLHKGRVLALKRWSPLLVFAVVAGGALTIAVALYRLENARHMAHFTLAVREQVKAMEFDIHMHFRPVQHLATAFSLREGIFDERRFLLFVQSIRGEESPALMALQWFPRRQAESGQETFPLGYSYSPVADQLSVPGNDWARVPDHIAAQAASQRDLLVTPWYSRDDQVRFRILRAVFRKGVGEPELLGFVSGLYRVDRLMTEVLCSPSRTEVITIFVTDPRSNITDYFHCAGTSARAVRVSSDSVGAQSAVLAQTRRFSVNGVTWIATTIAAPRSFIASRWIPFIIAFGGLMLAGILALLHQLMLRREVRVRQLVRDRTQQLEAMNQELEQFAYVASHDLKAPLRAISQLSSWVIEDAAEHLDEENLKRLRLMGERVIRMDRLIEGLLAYSRAGRITGEVREMIPLKPLLEELISELPLPAGFRVEVQDPLPTLRADALHLKQIFQNLITNAASHHDHPESGRAWIHAEEEERFWRVEVADNGPGIPAEEKETIFGMFTSLESETSQGHTGIGLTIVRKLVFSYGGKIDIVDNVPRGALFRIWWPKSLNHPP